MKRAYSLALRATPPKILARPYIEMLRESNARGGFFEANQFEAVYCHLSEAIRPAATFAYITGWRRSEILTLTWAQVDSTAGMVRLEPGTTKNGSGVPFPSLLSSARS